MTAADRRADAGGKCMSTYIDREWTAIEPTYGPVGVVGTTREAAWDHVLAWRRDGYALTYLASRPVAPWASEFDPTPTAERLPKPEPAEAAAERTSL